MGRARRLVYSPHTVVRIARLALPVLGLAWGIGTAVAVQHLSTATVAMLMLVLAAAGNGTSSRKS